MIILKIIPCVMVLTLFLFLFVPAFAEMDALSCLNQFSDPLCYGKDDLESVSGDDEHWSINLARFLESGLITRTEYVNSIRS